jgi:hypothetical protein
MPPPKVCGPKELSQCGLNSDPNGCVNNGPGNKPTCLCINDYSGLLCLTPPSSDPSPNTTTSDFIIKTTSLIRSSSTTSSTTVASTLLPSVTSNGAISATYESISTVVNQNKSEEQLSSNAGIFITVGSIALIAIMLMVYFIRRVYISRREVNSRNESGKVSLNASPITKKVEVHTNKAHNAGSDIPGALQVVISPWI